MKVTIEPSITKKYIENLEYCRNIDKNVRLKGCFATSQTVPF